jgi:TRAP-type C4-dicarboxylate transport system substrate-binding protein
MTVPRRYPLARSRAACTSLLLGVCLLVAGCSASVDKAGGKRAKAPVVLAMLNPLGGLETQSFVGAVDRFSDGALRIDVKQQWHEGQVSAEADLVHAVQAGQASLGLAPVRVWNALGVRSFDALIAPLEVDSLALEGEVLGSDLVDDMLVGPQQVGLTGIGILPGPIRRPVGVTWLFLGPQDYQGRTVAINDSAVAARTFGALHASAVPTVFMGRSIDGFDALELEVGAVARNQYDKTAWNITANVGLWPRPTVIFANPAALATLNDKQRQILRDAARVALQPMLDIDREPSELANLCRRGTVTFLTATASQLEALHRATAPVLAWLRKDSATREALDRIDSMRARLAAAGTAEDPPACGGIPAADPNSPEPSTTGTSLDGVYTMNSTYDDLLAVGAPPGDVPENYGAWVLVVDGDRFANTQVNGQACTWGYGSWRVDGQTVHWLFTDGGGIAPTSTMNRHGDYFGFNWSLYQDTLNLTRLPGSVSPENFLAKPWHRISRTPSIALLSSRCPPPAQALPRH